LPAIFAVCFALLILDNSMFLSVLGEESKVVLMLN
jgi:hypothetical protein